MADDYVHPSSGRSYQVGDAAHRFAQLIAALAQQCDEFMRHHGARLAGRDYLEQVSTWPSDPERIARSMARTLASIDEARTAVLYDRDAPTWGLGSEDDEWRRKYGPAIEPPADDRKNTDETGGVS